MANLSRRKYCAVDGLDTETDLYVVPNDKICVIRKMHGNGSHDSDIKIEFRWGDEVLWATHEADSYDGDAISVTGDGTKEIKIILENSTESQETFGGFWEGWVQD